MEIDGDHDCNLLVIFILFYSKRLRKREVEELPAIVALGKFDAMHIGHRSLASTAARLGGHPWMISFAGMAEVMGWDTSRLPLVAQVEQPIVLGEWTKSCLGHTPNMRYLPFAKIRNQSPEEFFKLLVNDLGAQGVVTGANYRFGYKASGDVSTLRELSSLYNVRVEVVDLVSCGGTNGSVIVSSSKVREALNNGDMQLVKQYLGRNYTLSVDSQKAIKSQSSILYPREAFLNQPPCNGLFQASINDCKLVEIEITDKGIFFQRLESPEYTSGHARIVFLS